MGKGWPGSLGGGKGKPPNLPAVFFDASANTKTPPAWGPELEGHYPFKTYIKDCMMWFSLQQNFLTAFPLRSAR